LYTHDGSVGKKEYVLKIFLSAPKVNKHGSSHGKRADWFLTMRAVVLSQAYAARVIKCRQNVRVTRYSRFKWFTTQGAAASRNDGQRSIVLEVHNLKCGGCANTAERALLALPGVRTTI
jgi:hypothetical protein